MKAVIFIESKEEGIQFKCDTFWSKSDKPRNAKVYSDNLNSLKDWLQSVLPHNIYVDKMEYTMNKYQGARLGYFTPDDSLYESGYSLKDDVKVEDLGNPIYLWSIEMNDISNWILKNKKVDRDGRESFDVESNSLGEFIDYKQIHRDELLKEILKEKESD